MTLDELEQQISLGSLRLIAAEFGVSGFDQQLDDIDQVAIAALAHLGPAFGLPSPQVTSVCRWLGDHRRLITVAGAQHPELLTILSGRFAVCTAIDHGLELESGRKIPLAQLAQIPSVFSQAISLTELHRLLQSNNDVSHSPPMGSA